MGRRQRIAVALLAAALGGAHARPASVADAAAPDGPSGAAPRSRGAFSIQTWRTDEGLPSDMVSDVVQDHEGYLWVATNAGVARFDGVKFEIHDLDNTPALASDACASVSSMMLLMPVE